MKYDKSIIIFGAGLNQTTLIQAANNLGLRSVVLDPNTNCPGRQFANYFYVVKGHDYENTKRIAIKHKVSGLATTQLEKPLRLMAKLAMDLGLPFLDPEVVERSLDKWLMKLVFWENNVPCANAKLFMHENEITDINIEELQYPIIIKPKNATSSQGVFKIDSSKQIGKYAKITSSFSKNGEIIAEKFLEGPEYSVESVTYHGETKIIQYTEKFLTPFPNTVEMGHLQPADLSDNQKKSIEKIVESAIKAIKIDNSATHTEIKMTKEGPKVLEISPRGGGDFISSYLTMASTGINMDEAIINVALNNKPDLLPKKNQFSYIRYFDLPPCKKVSYINNLKNIFNQPDVIFSNVSIKPGDVIEKITESKKRPGFIIVKGNTRKVVKAIAKKYIDYIKTNIILN